MATLRRSGVDGPYAMALGNRCYTGVVESTHDGYPVLEHLRLVLDGGPVVWAPAVEGAIVLSMRGGDFELVVGEDFSIGYRGHSDHTVSFVLEETMLFRVNGPEAAIPLGVRDHWIERPRAREPGRRLGLRTRVLIRDPGFAARLGHISESCRPPSLSTTTGDAACRLGAWRARHRAVNFRSRGPADVGLGGERWAMC